MRELIRLLVEQLVNNPGAVEIREARADTASVIELRVAKEDLGRVIGRQGRTAQALRTILNAIASRNNRKVILQIIEEMGPGDLTQVLNARVTGNEILKSYRNVECLPVFRKIERISRNWLVYPW